MIIQHNIMALNAHRQLSGNNSLVSKNLEKLSSGYRINRAGDDAAGLAISEKMRSQIKGLERAQANAQDGISLVQTAEGALTEVHSMLNRLVELGTESANGTIQANDRQKIQDEVDALTSEIDRISKATNFNGIKLLDGSLGSISTTKKVGGTTGATSAVAVYDFSADLTAGGTELPGSTITIATVANDTIAAGTTNKVAMEAFATKITAAGDWTAVWDDTERTMTLTAQTAGTAATTPGASTGALTATPDFTAGAAAGASKGSTELKFNKQPVAGTTMTIGNSTFEFVAAAGDQKTGNTAIVIGATAALTAAAVDTALTAATISHATYVAGSDTITLNSADANAVDAKIEGDGLVLQIGDTADDFNKVSVSVADMSSTGLGINGLAVTTEGLSAASIKKVNDAVEIVSTARGKLGALQNRLEHTINNLGVTTENMTAAESRIRDVDMAKEMMAFTKNNVLTQAAQAMLAQANQQPQQVLQLLR